MMKLMQKQFKSRQNIIEEKKRRRKREELINTGRYIISENADPNNILIDTCSLNSKMGTNVIDASEKVNVLYGVIEEMDRIKAEIRRKRKLKKEERVLISNIGKYTIRMLQERKYNLIPYFNLDICYVDNIILEYLKNVPKEKRMTILTADKLLALKAQCLNFEFILVLLDKEDNQVEPTNNKVIVEKSSKQERKLHLLGVEISYVDEEIIIKQFNPYCKIYAIKQDELKSIEKQDKINIFDVDYIYIIQKTYKKMIIYEVGVKDGKLKRKENGCYVLNDIYKLDLHEEILEKAKQIFIN